MKYKTEKCFKMLGFTKAENVCDVDTDVELASFLINAQPFPAHSSAADDNSLIGCTSHDLTGDCSLTSTHFVDSQYPFRYSFGCVLLLNQMFCKQCTVRQYHSDLSDQSTLEIRVRNLG